MNTIRKFKSSMKMTSKMRRVLQTAFLLSAFLYSLVPVGEAVWLDVPPSGTKCVYDQIQSNVVVMCDYVIISEDHSLLPSISVKVTSPFGNTMHHMENISHGDFAFTTQESGNYMACFSADTKSHGNKNVSLNIDWKTGIATKDWNSVAKKEKIEGVELEIRKLEGAIEAIHENLIYLRNKEADMRILSEKTNSRVAWFSIMSLAICIVVSGLQVVYLKRYFQQKKLI